MLRCSGQPDGIHMAPDCSISSISMLRWACLKSHLAFWNLDPWDLASVLDFNMHDTWTCLLRANIFVAIRHQRSYSAHLGSQYFTGFQKGHLSSHLRAFCDVVSICLAVGVRGWRTLKPWGKPHPVESFDIMPPTPFWPQKYWVPPAADPRQGD